jgi:tetratricopeptide (TPR) repeat protein
MTQSEGNASSNASGERSMANSGSISNSMIITGDNNVIHPSLPPQLTSTPSNLSFIGTNNFVGRTETLNRLHEALQGNTRVAITAVAGMGGVGKTELAIQYAQRYWNSYPAGIGWFLVRSSDIGVQILSFASSFGLVPPDNPALKERVRYVWQHWPVRPGAVVGAAISEPGDVLLVFDDVDKYEKVKPYLPLSNPRFKVLLTSRVQLGSPIRSISLDVLVPADALELLGVLEQNGRVEKEPQEAEEICKRLGYLPLGLELVGCYLECNEDLKLAQMLQRLSAGLADEALNPEKKPELRTAQLGVRAAFELSWEELNEQEQEVACLLSLFASAPIPWRLVESYRLDWNAKDLEKIRDGKLRKLSLLERYGEGLYRLHPLIREYFGEKILKFAGAEGMKRAYCGVMVNEARDFPRKPTRPLWEEFAPLVPHLIEVYNMLLEQIEYENLILISRGVAHYFEGQGIYTQAEPWHERCLEMCRQHLGEEHLEVARSMSNLANLYYSLGRYEQAKSLFMQALEIDKKVYGVEHQEVASLMSNLANLYYSLGRYEQAEPLFMQALEMRERLLGGQHQEVASSMSNLALLYYSLGRYEQAKSLFMQALEIDKKVYGVEHPKVASLMSNLANLYCSLERYQQAEPLYLQSLEIDKKVYGAEHPEVASSMSNLANLYCSQSRYEQAEPLLIQALEMRKRLLGAKHPEVASSMSNLAILYNSRHCYEKSKALLTQAWKISIDVLGSEHPKTIIIYQNFRNTTIAQQKYLFIHHFLVPFGSLVTLRYLWLFFESLA